MAPAVATPVEVHSLGMQFHDLSNAFAEMSATLLDEDMPPQVVRGEHDELTTVLRTLRTLARGVESLLEVQGVPF